MTVCGLSTGKMTRQRSMQSLPVSPADIYSAEGTQTAEAWAWADSDCGPFHFFSTSTT